MTAARVTVKEVAGDVNAMKVDAAADRQMLIDHVKECDKGRARNDRAHGWLFRTIVAFGTISVTIGAATLKFIIDHIVQ